MAPMLPAQPIRDWLESHPVYVRSGQNTAGKFAPAACPRPCYLTWIKQEMVTVYQADAMCIDWLKIHPTVLYGDDFWIGIEDEAI